jgi:myo-inositol-1(or 4)-monophosphatase
MAVGIRLRESCMNDEFLNFAKETALLAGEVIRNKFGTITRWRTKEGRGDVVTEVDIESEALVLRRIREAYPTHNIVTEESGRISGVEGEPTWYIDPLDGTGNYTRGIPFFATTLAVARGNQVLASATYDPLRDEMFNAAFGMGAYLNDKLLRIEPDDNMEDVSVSLSWSRRREGSDLFPRYIERLAPHTSYFRRLGSAALAIAYVAAGRIDAYIQGQINPWDIAAGVLMMSEAGGLVTDFDGNPVDLGLKYSDILAANTALHKRLREEVLSTLEDNA